MAKHRRSGTVKISWLPGFEPTEKQPTKFPFPATINGTVVTVWPDRIEWPEEEDDAALLRLR